MRYIDPGIVPPHRRPMADRIAVDRVPVAALLRADSPRLAGENEEHARMLAESGAALPPIVVHRPTMRVIDGMHRLRAAVLRGDAEISVLFFDGDQEEAFIVAVETNVAHGLPLSLADRTAAAVRILASRPDWSDRRIAAVTGLGATTVAAVRQRSTDRSGRSNTAVRIGRDGRVRPLSAAAGRLLASRLLEERPDAPIREIAAAAGVSPSTALDVRNRLRDGADPVPARQRSTDRVDRTTRPARSARRNDAEYTSVLTTMDSPGMLQSLRRDPSLRFTDGGRALLRWLDSYTAGLQHWRNHAGNVPAHCAQAIAELARRNGNAWYELAESLEARTNIGA